MERERDIVVAFIVVQKLNPEVALCLCRIWEYRVFILQWEINEAKKQSINCVRRNSSCLCELGSGLHGLLNLTSLNLNTGAEWALGKLISGYCVAAGKHGKNWHNKRKSVKVATDDRGGRMRCETRFDQNSKWAAGRTRRKRILTVPSSHCSQPFLKRINQIVSRCSEIYNLLTLILTDRSI